MQASRTWGLAREVAPVVARESDSLVPDHRDLLRHYTREELDALVRHVHPRPRTRQLPLRMCRFQWLMQSRLANRHR